MSIQTSSFPQSSEGVQITDNSQEMLEQANQLLKDSNKGYDDRINIKQSGVLDSCTLVEGLLFPVEYYIRTTRRMAASHSSVDLDAVIYSQLTGGRGRRRLSQSQTSGRGHITPEHSVCSPLTRPDAEEKVKEEEEAVQKALLHVPKLILIVQYHTPQVIVKQFQNQLQNQSPRLTLNHPANQYWFLKG